MRKQAMKKNVVLNTLRIEYLKASVLRPNPYNPNRQSEEEFELLKRSMKEDGFTQPIIVCPMKKEHLKDPKFSKYSVDDIVIVDGEHRWRCGQELGYKEVPIVAVDMPAEQMRISTLRHNRARGTEDIALSAEVLRDLQALGALDWAKDSLMLTDVELNRLLDDIPIPETLKGDDFSEAWIPVASSDAMTEEQDLVETKDRNVGMSLEAHQRVRDMERKLQEAKTEEDKIVARKEANIFRLVLVFTGEQADVVKTALGKKPAETVLEMCTEKAGL